VKGGEKFFEAKEESGKESGLAAAK